MPPKSRCAYREENRRGRSVQCTRNGSGNPPLCAVHRSLFENDIGAPASVGERLGNVLGKVFRGQRVSDRDLGGAISDGINVMFGGVFGGAPGVGNTRPDGSPSRGVVADWAYEQLKQREAQQRAAADASRGSAAHRTAELAKAKAALGWKNGIKLTVEVVNKRRRELARKHHPDRAGGSVAKMQEINAAADLLIAELEGPATAGTTP